MIQHLIIEQIIIEIVIGKTEFSSSIDRMVVVLLVIRFVDHVVMIHYLRVMINLRIIIIAHHFQVISLNHLHRTMKHVHHRIVQVQLVKIPLLVRRRIPLHHFHLLLLLHHFLLHLHRYHRYHYPRFITQCMHIIMICICNKQRLIPCKKQLTRKEKESHEFASYSSSPNSYADRAAAYAREQAQSSSAPSSSKQ